MGGQELQAPSWGHPSGRAGQGVGRISAPTLGCSGTLSALSLLAGSCMGAAEERELMDSPCSTQTQLSLWQLKGRRDKALWPRASANPNTSASGGGRRSRSLEPWLCASLGTHWAWITQQHFGATHLQDTDEMLPSLWSPFTAPPVLLLQTEGSGDVGGYRQYKAQGLGAK